MKPTQKPTQKAARKVSGLIFSRYALVLCFNYNYWFTHSYEDRKACFRQWASLFLWDLVWYGGCFLILHVAIFMFSGITLVVGS